MMQDPAFARRKTWPAEQQPQVGLGHMINSTCRLAQPEARGLPVQLEVPTKHAPRRNGTVTACGPLQWIQFLVHAEGNMSVRFHASGTCHPSMALTTRYTTTASPGRVPVGALAEASVTTVSLKDRSLMLLKGIQPSRRRCTGLNRRQPSATVVGSDCTRVQIEVRKEQHLQCQGLRTSTSRPST